MSNDPLRTYETWRRKEERAARAWAVVGWLAMLVSAVVFVTFAWIIVSLLIIVFG